MIAMTYNLLTGGRPGRLDAIVEIIRTQRPDVLALQELQGFDRAALDRLATATGLAAYLARSRSGQPVAVLVRPGATVTAARRVRGPFRHAAAELTVATDRGPLTVIGTHLNSYSRIWRLAESRALARRIDPDRLTLLMGDLNGPPAIPGLVDLFRPGGPVHSVPTRFKGEEFTPSRLDHILATRPLAALARGYRIVTGGAADTASDHYPVVADLDLAIVCK
jgi:exodeoxyribonuclease III